MGGRLQPLSTARCIGWLITVMWKNGQQAKANPTLFPAHFPTFENNNKLLTEITTFD